MGLSDKGSHQRFSSNLLYNLSNHSYWFANTLIIVNFILFQKISDNEQMKEFCLIT